ncbi:hypothetical protein [Propionimicrobium lymphophilum]|uniref:hypothetical protein n=1 Tax=Propionimicrobium lymphophilum TaxID=33012 RepID=UPI0023F567C6|nr:hypothetical protein [Propionimicrobium lymphophilum]
MIGRTESKQLTNNVFGVALIFEGGGMRNSATAPVVVELLRNRIHFDWVAGISAGSTHLAKYLSRDQVRATRSFIHLAADPGYWKLPNLASGQRADSSRNARYPRFSWNMSRRDFPTAP